MNCLAESNEFRGAHIGEIKRVKHDNLVVVSVVTQRNLFEICAHHRIHILEIRSLVAWFDESGGSKSE